MLVLVVDDDPDIRRVYEIVLTDSGHSMCWAESVDGARRLLASERGIGLVLLDYNLSGEAKGIDVALDVSRRIPVFMVSGTSRAEMAERVANTLEGVTLFLQKPVNIHELLDEIARVDRTRVKP